MALFADSLPARVHRAVRQLFEEFEILGGAPRHWT